MKCTCIPVLTLTNQPIILALLFICHWSQGVYITQNNYTMFPQIIVPVDDRDGDHTKIPTHFCGGAEVHIKLQCEQANIFDYSIHKRI